MLRLVVAGALAFSIARLAASSDLVLTVPTYDKNHFILEAGRTTWRKNLFTLVSTNGATGAEYEVEQPFQNELWVAAPDGHAGWEGRGGNKAEQRCVGLLRTANTSAKVGLFNWLLNSDDDVVWYEDNVRELVNRLDANKPYYVTDGFLNDVWTGCSLENEPLAPLHSDGCVRAPATQPCFRSVLEDPAICRHQILKNHTPGTWASAMVQVGAYGNSGSIMSRALLHSVSEADFEACEQCNSTRFTCMYGADWRIGECFLAFAANGNGIGPTLPRIYSSNFRQFGHPAEDVLQLSNRVISGEHCDERCRMVLNNVVTSPVSTHDKTRDEYRSQVKALFDTYMRAKQILQAGKPSVPVAPAGQSSFSYRAASDPFLNGRDNATSLPFLPNFLECASSSNPLTSPVLERNYGPFSQGGAGFTVAGFRRREFAVLNASSLPFVDVAVGEPNEGVRNVPSAQSFKGFMRSINRQSPVFLAAFSRTNGKVNLDSSTYHAGFTPMAISWFGHAAHVGLADYVVFLGFDWKDCEAVRQYAPCIFHSDTLRAATHFWDAMNGWPANFRWIYSYLLLETGFDHVSLDVDGFLMMNPVPYLLKGKEVAGLSDRGYHGESPMEYCDIPNSPCVSTGFTYLRATPDVLRVVRNFTLHYNGGWEQATWNVYAIELLLLGKYDILPNNGSVTFANWGGTVQKQLENKQDFDLALLHLGGMGSNDGKEFVMRCAQVWLDERNLEP